MKKIVVDARLWGIRHTGIGRYIENLLDYLPQSENAEISVIIPPDLVAEPKLAQFKKYCARFHPYSPLAQFEMLWLLLQARPHLLHVTHFTIPVLWPGRMVITIHDLIKHESRGAATTTRSPQLYWLKYIGYLVLVQLAVWRASHIIVPAEFWKDDLVRRFKISRQKITAIYEGVDATRFVFAPDYSPKSYVIYTGNVYPHKNIPVLLRAVKLLNGKMKLIIVCSRSVFLSRISSLADSLGISHLVEFKHNIPDRELSGLLSHSTAFVTPSLIEGFGLPGLEAMSAGTPVISAQASCLPEIYGSAALYFSPSSPSELAKRIHEVSVVSKLREELISQGQAQIKKYSWAKMSQQTWQIYQNCLMSLRV